MNMKEHAEQVIEIASRWSAVGIQAKSAGFCLDDAVSCFNRGFYDYAITRAIDSLRYSVGIFGDAYKQALSVGK